ncbi:MAG: PilZ domain-containing protein [Lachnospiraceae bacterium]|nr:PilZ domain-containing protein [Lachnospiraceae bacterium]
MSVEQGYTKRDYVRTNNFSVNAKISEDGKVWQKVKVPNIAAGGLLFLTDNVYEPGHELWFNLEIDTKITIVVPISVKLKGVIKVDRGLEEQLHMYAVIFTDISKSDQIRLDELVRMAIAKYGDF